MRPWRQVFALGCCIVLTVFCVLNSQSATSVPQNPYDTQPTNRLSAFFSFRTPGSLFPLNALISLTDENSTFFSARPANFGPLLPSRGLNGQLWIGNGFGDGALSRRGIATGAEGELGCSDDPGLIEGDWSLSTGLDYSKWTNEQSVDAGKPDRGRLSSSKSKRSMSSLGNAHGHDRAVSDAMKDDGTDDYLHKSFAMAKPGSKHVGYAKNGLSKHADIQSLQESAEINGKIVLLSRGGCGFFEKVSWAQRRGAIAVIVADNIPGGALVTMNARGDTSNITIPSVFTHHTTAHILASLIPPGFDSITPPTSKPGYMFSSTSKSSTGSNTKEKMFVDKGAVDVRTFTQTAASVIHTPTSKISSPESSSRDGGLSSTSSIHSGWWSSFWSLITFGYGSAKGSSDGFNSRRPPSSGNLDWLMVEDWDNDEPRKQTGKGLSSGTEGSSDGFVIGIQDWRDPDVTAPDSTTSNLPEGTTKTSSLPTDTLESNAITPGSGEYVNASPATDDMMERSRKTHDNENSDSARQHETDEGGWLKNLGWASTPADESDVLATTGSDQNKYYSTKSRTAPTNNESEPPPETHQGLWVTLTPSSISTSPFFDTLIVLVISPLVTLTIVYVMLLVRSRIRRRRWRAPKSLVDRLPVRTYHIQSPRSSSPSPGISNAVPCTSTTPLLASVRAIETRSRPRSRTIGDSPENLSVPSGYGSLDSTAEQEKLDAGLAEWRRRYGGRQVECIVCLEEYVDGVSKVMSLPCGHEFHPECITPWLTTRRRTCPICKGDVVRSMTKSPPAKSGSSHLLDDSDEDYQAQAAETVNDSPSAAMPIAPEGFDDDDDLERAEEPTLASQSLPTLRLPRNFRNGLHALRTAGGRRNELRRARPPANEGRDR